MYNAILPNTRTLTSTTLEKLRNALGGTVIHGMATYGGVLTLMLDTGDAVTLKLASGHFTSVQGLEIQLRSLPNGFPVDSVDPFLPLKGDHGWRAAEGHDIAGFALVRWSDALAGKVVAQILFDVPSNEPTVLEVTVKKAQVAA